MNGYYPYSTTPIVSNGSSSSMTPTNKVKSALLDMICMIYQWQQAGSEAERKAAYEDCMTRFRPSDYNSWSEADKQSFTKTMDAWVKDPSQVTHNCQAPNRNITLVGGKRRGKNTRRGYKKRKQTRKMKRKSRKY